MGRKKTWKNPEVTDIQRDRWLKRRMLEERGSLEELAKARDVLGLPRPRSLEEKFADYVRGKTKENHLTPRLTKSVLFGLEYGTFYYPKTREEKSYDADGLQRIYTLTHLIRKKKRYGYISLGNEILHENPDLLDLEYVMVDFIAERPKNSRKKSQVLLEWETNRSEIRNTMGETIRETVERAQLPIAEIERLAREEQERRRKRNTNNDDEDDK